MMDHKGSIRRRFAHHSGFLSLALLPLLFKQNESPYSRQTESVRRTDTFLYFDMLFEFLDGADGIFWKNLMEGNQSMTTAMIQVAHSCFHNRLETTQITHHRNTVLSSEEATNQHGKRTTRRTCGKLATSKQRTRTTVQDEEVNAAPAATLVENLKKWGGLERT
jgi:hypothetical protein